MTRNQSDPERTLMRVQGGWGAQWRITIPSRDIATLGWKKGDKIRFFAREGDLVLVNQTR